MLWLGLVLALVSAVAVNWAYTLEHAAVASLPPMSPRHPVRAARALLRSRAWLAAFGAETAGFAVYLVSLRLAPLALVQAVGATGIAVLAFLAVRGDPARLGVRERAAVALAVAGLILLALSLAGSRPPDRLPSAVGAIVWLGACGGAAVALSASRLRFQSAATLGLAAGLLFSGGDISSKLAVHGGAWTVAGAALIAFYALGSIQLQSAFQHGAAVTAAGLATLTTNAVPIAAGVVLLGEIPSAGAARALEIAAFAAVVAGGVLLTDPRAGAESQREEAPELTLRTMRP